MRIANVNAPSMGVPEFSEAVTTPFRCKAEDEQRDARRVRYVRLVERSPV
jgi:hypothetical protein